MNALVQLGEDLAAVREAVYELHLAGALERPVRTEIPPELAEWVGHLAFLKWRVDGGGLTAELLEPREADGLAILREEHARLERLLAECPNCKRTTRRGTNCDRCGRRMEGLPSVARHGGAQGGGRA